MPTNLANTAPIDQNDLQFDALLSNLQGNILKGHGRDHTANIFVEFDPARLAEAREWIHLFTDEHVTSAKRQLKENERFKRNGVPGGLFAGVYVTALGCEFFKVAKGKKPGDASFQGGMEKAKLNDPLRAKWDAPFRELNIHLMILLGHDDKLELSLATAAVVKELRPLTVNDEFVSEGILIEYGNAIRNANGDGLEHFGYVDGVSQPLFFQDENAKFEANATPSTPGGLHWTPFAPLKQVLVADPLVAVEDACGSYFVFRKLEQDVLGFKRAEKDVAKKLGLEGEEEELAGALVVGRYEDGTPVTLLPVDGLIGSGAANNFNYDADLLGLKCPFQAHIRKSNPRGTGGQPEEEGGQKKEPRILPPDEVLALEKSRIMARRGIPFGQREVTPAIEAEPEQFPSGGGVGLLFMSFQASLADQFEFIQKQWVNNATFPKGVTPAHTGIDPLIGQSAATPDPKDREYEWPAHYDQAGPTVKKEFASFITMKGGEYFFAPSLDGLRAL